jgi:hypothetical protein
MKRTRQVLELLPFATLITERQKVMLFSITDEIGFVNPLVGVVVVRDPTPYQGKD